MLVKQLVLKPELNKWPYSGYRLLEHFIYPYVILSADKNISGIRTSYSTPDDVLITGFLYLNGSVLNVRIIDIHTDYSIYIYFPSFDISRFRCY